MSGPERPCDSQNNPLDFPRASTAIDRMMVMKLILVLAAMPAAASFALGGKIDGPGKPKAAADVEPGAVCKRMTESTEESIARPFRAGR